MSLLTGRSFYRMKVRRWQWVVVCYCIDALARHDTTVARIGRCTVLKVDGLIPHPVVTVVAVLTDWSYQLPKLCPRPTATPMISNTIKIPISTMTHLLYLGSLLAAR